MVFFTKHPNKTVFSTCLTLSAAVVFMACPRPQPYGSLVASRGASTVVEQFGQAISKFQGIRWIIADMATEIEAARQLMFLAAAMKDRNEKYTMQASMAKLYASEMVNRVTAKALQIHGGYGYTKEYPAEKFFRDCKIGKIYEGTSNMQLQTIAKTLLT